MKVEKHLPDIVGRSCGAGKGFGFKFLVWWDGFILLFVWINCG